MREWLVDLVGEELAPIVTYVLSAAIIITLLLVVIWVARKALGGSVGPRAKGRGPRLAVMDVAAIDPKRKLVLVRRDEVEHLLLIGGQNDVVVEASILRVPASARAQRTEPTMRPAEVDQAADRQQPGALPIAPAAIQPPSKAAVPSMPPQRLAAGAAQRPPEARPASPLARSVPRQPMPAPAQQDAEPQRLVPPAPVVRQPTAPNDMPLASAGAVAQKPTPTAPSRPADAPAVEIGAAMPPRPEPRFPEMRDQVETAEPAVPEPGNSEDQRPISEAPIPAAVAPPVASPQREQEPRRESPAAPRVEMPATSPAAPGVVSQPSAPAGAPRIEPERRSASTAGGNRPDPVVERPAAALRTPEPARRSIPQQTVQPIQPRSMATPTYRAASPFVGLGDDDGRIAAQPVDPRLRAERSPDVRQEGASADQAASVPPPAGDAASVPAQSRGPAQQPAFPPQPAPAGNALLSGLLGLKPTAPSSPIIAAAERQREALRPRPTPSLDAAPQTESAGQAGPMDDAAEKRPLSVRSFATSIQSMKPSAETPAVPPQPAPAPAVPELAPQRREPELKPPLPAFVAPPVAAAVATPVAAAPLDAAKSEASRAEDPGSNLDDFLSAELDSDFGNVSWDDEPAPAKAPDVRVDAPTSAEAKSEPPRVLTLEEEMERLLGDFDFDTSDRRAR